MGGSDPPMALNHARHQPWRSRPSRLSPTILAAIALLIFIQFSTLPQLFTEPGPASQRLSDFYLDQLKSGLDKCTELKAPPVQYQLPASSTRKNPRWTPSTGQKDTVVLRNVTLFDGENILGYPIDVVFAHGIVESISPVSETAFEIKDAQIFYLAGAYVTPGLVDMHSHHLVGSWPASSVADDTNEVNIAAFGPLTPFVRALDSIKPYDIATKIIASGGITTSLILPGSANIMGGEGFLVKNFMNSGEHKEEVVEDLLLEHGVPHTSRRRYMKMACGENPKGVYDHTRMGNAWILRKHLSRARELMEKQDQWCLSAEAALESDDSSAISALVRDDSGNKGGLPEELELDSSVAMLRGKIGINIHCYEPEDFEDMILHSKEFGFRIQAFHHALSAWKVPELIKDSGYNITIATFAEFGLYKQEGYEANLWAGGILAKHGVPVAYKSDHGEEETNAKYLLSQAAVAHAFHLPANLALQSVTSVPARSLEIDHRVGYVRPGYDADIVIWNYHPLAVGATPLQVYIDGRATLDPKKVAETLPQLHPTGQMQVETPRMRMWPEPMVKEDTCRALRLTAGKSVLIKGIKKSFLDLPTAMSSSGSNLTMLVEGGKMVCFGPQDTCISTNSQSTIIELENGHVAPGLTAFSSNLGLSEISGLEETKDGTVSKNLDPLKAENVLYAKYGVHLDGKAFKRARIGGVTRAVTAPIMDTEFLGGVSVGIKTGGKKTVLDGGIFQEDVSLHLIIGQDVKGSDSTPTVSSAVMKLRKILVDNVGKDSVYGKAANGTIPIVVRADSKYDIMQLIKIKQDCEKVNIVINGGAGAPALAAELAAAHIPVILNPFRGAPWHWENLDSLVGPPLTKSSAQVLSEAGVAFGIAMGGFTDSHIQSLSIEASWAAKYAGLSERAAIDLVSRNIEKIMGIDIKEEERDIVVFEGNPLEFGASVVVSVDGDDKSVMDCWPDAE